MFDVNVEPDAREVIVDPMDDLRQKNLAGLRFETLLEPLARGGAVVLAPRFRNAMAVLERLPISYQDKADQLETIMELIKSKKVKAQYGTWPEAAAKQTVANWRRQAEQA